MEEKAQVAKKVRLNRLSFSSVGLGPHALLYSPLLFAS